MPATTDERLKRRAAQVPCPADEIDDRHQDGPVDRGAAADEKSVRNQRRRGTEHGCTTEHAREPEYRERESGQQRDVAA